MGGVIGLLIGFACACCAAKNFKDGSYGLAGGLTYLALVYALQAALP